MEEKTEKHAKYLKIILGVLILVLIVGVLTFIGVNNLKSPTGKPTDSEETEPEPTGTATGSCALKGCTSQEKPGDRDSANNPTTGCPSQKPKADCEAAKYGECSCYWIEG